jgi:hypothetical protein
MAQLFHRSTNQLSKVSIVLILAGLGGATWGTAWFSTSGYVTGEDDALSQPVPFSHNHHFAGLGISCLYCHTSVETSAVAGIPPVATCMNCHKQIWTNAELLEPVRAAYRSGVPVQWERVHDLPDYVYFNHSVHVAKGIGCQSCHGQMERMPLVHQAVSLTMKWCLDCHREPEKFVRPRSAIYEFDWPPQGWDQETEGPRLVEEYGIESLTYCSVCHR